MPRPKRTDLVPVQPGEPVELPDAPKWDLDLAELDAQAADSLGTAPRFTIRIGDEAFAIPSPILMSDEATQRMARVNNNEDLDPVDNTELRNELARMMDAELLDRVWEVVSQHVQVPGRTIDGKPADQHHIRLARAILGDDVYARFVAAGGSANRVHYAFGQLSAGLGNDPKPRT